MTFAHGFGLRQWLEPQLSHVTGGDDGRLAPQLEQKRTAVTPREIRSRG
jgi:hypothetical protein